MTSTNTYPEFLYFNCGGKFVIIRPSPTFWPRVTNTIYELKKYGSKERIFVNMSAKDFHRYVAPIFTLGYVSFNTGNWSGNWCRENIKREVLKWVSGNVLWEAMLESQTSTFLGDFMYDLDHANCKYVRKHSCSMLTGRCLKIKEVCPSQINESLCIYTPMPYPKSHLCKKCKTYRQKYPDDNNQWFHTGYDRCGSCEKGAYTCIWCNKLSKEHENVYVHINYTEDEARDLVLTACKRPRSYDIHHQKKKDILKNKERIMKYLLNKMLQYESTREMYEQVYGPYQLKKKTEKKT